MHLSNPAPRRSDGGFVIVLLALVLIVLLIFTAFVVDLGAVYNARRQDQNAADSGVLGGANESLSATTDSQITAEVIRLVDETLTADATAFDWDSCTATDTDSIDIEVNGLSCITRDASRDRLQVRVPTRQYNTFFAQVVGVDTFDHTAFAIAGIEPAGLGGVLPLPIGSDAGGGDGLECIRTGTPSSVDEIPPCDEPTTGNFGSLDFGLWDTADCSGDPKDRWAHNVSSGVDHILGLYTGTIANEETLCPGTSSTTRPNAASTVSVTGLTTQEVGDALFVGLSDGTLGRLERFDSNIAQQATDVAGNDLDDNGLWEFIDPDLDTDDVDDTTTLDDVEGDVPLSCEADNFGASPTPALPTTLENHFASPAVGEAEEKRILLMRCLAQYNDGTFEPEDIFNSDGSAFVEAGSGCASYPCQGAVFTRNSSSTEEPDLYDIQYTARFAYVPQLASGFTTGSNPAAWSAFRAVYLQRLFGGQCNPTCSFDFEPGVGFSAPSSTEDKAAGLVVFVLPADTLPGRLGYSDAVTELGENFVVRLLR